MYGQLHAELESYPFEADKQQLLHGLKFGFLLHYAGPRVSKEAKNLQSAREAPEILQKNWPKKSPFDTIPFPSLRVSPVGQFPAKDMDFRLIYH